MTDVEIAALKKALGQGLVCFYPDPEMFIRVTAVVSGDSIQPEPEPSDCAALMDGGCIALYNAELSEFKTSDGTLISDEALERLAKAGAVRAERLAASKREA